MKNSIILIVLSALVVWNAKTDASAKKIPLQSQNHKTIKELQKELKQLKTEYKKILLKTETNTSLF